ncbi:MAG: hypothetical protein WAW41_00090 [Methylobacter sp.]
MAEIQAGSGDGAHGLRSEAMGPTPSKPDNFDNVELRRRVALDLRVTIIFRRTYSVFEFS